MANDTVVRNMGDAPFVQDEYDSAETNIFAGHMLELDTNTEVIKHDADASSLDTADAAGRGMMADLPSFDPDVEKDEDLTGGNSGERIRVQHVPVGGIIEARLAAGGDLTDSTRANVDETTVLEEVTLGALAEHDGTDTTGDGTGAATETTFDAGALYMPREALDNSGAAAGVGNQIYIEVVRIA